MPQYFKCDKCESTLVESFFKDGSNTCVICLHNAGVSFKEPEKVQHTYEEVEDKGCTGGACTL